MRSVMPVCDHFSSFLGCVRVSFLTFPFLIRTWHGVSYGVLRQNRHTKQRKVPMSDGQIMLIRLLCYVNFSFKWWWPLLAQLSKNVMPWWRLPFYTLTPSAESASCDLLSSDVFGITMDIVHHHHYLAILHDNDDESSHNHLTNRMSIDVDKVVMPTL